MSDALTPRERTTLAEQEQIIERGLVTFLEVGGALLTIRSERLYRASHRTFEDYCRERWDMGRSRAYQLIDAAQVVSSLSESVSTTVDKTALPQSERQVRELKAAPEELRAEAWAQAQEDAGAAQPTARQVKEAVRKLTEEPGEEPAQPQRAALPQHRSESNEWYTPADIIERVREAFGGRIDLDPASCVAANEVVLADAIWTEEEDGLSCEWWGKVFLNPPYGRGEGHVSNLARWTESAIARLESGEITDLILLVKASTGEAWFRRLWSGWVCFPYRRLQFRLPGETGQTAGAPHSSALIYFGPHPDLFAHAFWGIGRIVPPELITQEDV